MKDIKDMTIDELSDKAIHDNHGRRFAVYELVRRLHEAEDRASSYANEILEMGEHNHG
jgi:hypothetical protein